MQNKPESERPIDRMMELIKERGHITADESSKILGLPKQNCHLILSKLFRNWNVLDRKIIGKGRSKTPVYYLKE
jgi:hypothetical protein